ncbi:D(1A) dopamine receptor-like [Amphiura filiformis]|uniref:D(1A) dopamine receptor-like n=1 Tax=Amphiura filiformis TaxID=82378 RepID=UPI003B228D15
METICRNGSNSSLCGDYTTQFEDFVPIVREPYQNIIGAIFILIIIILSILGNVAVILAIVRTPRLREELSSILLINLSLTDLLSATFVMPYTFVALLADEWLLGPEWCTGQCALNYCCIIVSMLTLSMISIDRHVAIVYPLRYASVITSPLIYAMSTYTWIQAFAFAAVPIVCKWVVYDYWEIVCAIDWDSYRDHGGLTYVIVAFVLCFMVPAGIMLVSYIRIYRAAKGHYRRRSCRQQMRTDPHQQKQERKVIISLAVVVVMFFICTTPFCVTKVIKIFFSSDVVPVWLNFVATYAQYIASATNPFIYGIFRTDFRKAFSRLICSIRVLPYNNNTNTNSINASDKLNNSVNTHQQYEVNMVKAQTEITLGNYSPASSQHA